MGRVQRKIYRVRWKKDRDIDDKGHNSNINMRYVENRRGNIDIILLEHRLIIFEQ
jgi:hypothetical protein